MQVVYRKKATRPAAAIRPGAAVCIGPANPEELLEDAVLVALERALEIDEALEEMDEEREEMTPEAELAADEPSLDKLEASPEMDDATLETADPAEEKMVVDPTMEVKTDEPEVMTLSMAEVVRAVLEASDPVEDAPAPPAPKMVVDPTVETAPSDAVLTIADVVMAELESDPSVVVLLAPVPVVETRVVRVAGGAVHISFWSRSKGKGKVLLETAAAQ